MTVSQEKPSRLVVTGDIVRPTSDGNQGHQNFNINWLHAILAWPLHAATGMTPERLVWEPGGFDAPRFYDSFGVSPSPQAWAELYNRPDCPRAAEDQVLAHLADALVVAFELCPLLTGILERYAIPYLNLMIHPVRFLDDIFFGIATNSPDIYRVLLEKRAPESLFYALAGVHAAAGKRLRGPGPGPDCVLIAGQTPQDKAMIRDGRFLDLDDYRADIEALVAGHGNVLLKKHPLAPEISPDLESILVRRGIRFTDQNLYTLLSENGLGAVYSISSSASHEAKYFGKHGEYFYRQQYDLADDDTSEFSRTRYVAIVDGTLDADFWRQVLSPATPTTPLSGVSLPSKPNRLRLSMREFWGYNEVDVDVTTNLFMDANIERYIESYLDRHGTRFLRRALKHKLKRLISGRSRDQ